MKRVCVFCGSRVGLRPEYRTAAVRLGESLVARGLGLVFGAGHIGLMGVVADAVLQAGGEVIGVIPQAMVDRELAHMGLTQLHIVDTMHQRKALMADLSDGFLALPGGFGTADELFEILTWRQLGIHDKPIGLCNVAEFFKPLLGWVDQCVTDGFLRTAHRDTLLVDDDPVTLIEKLLSARPTPDASKWADGADPR